MNGHKLTKRKKRIIIIVSSVVLILGITAYLLADRYLIEHLQLNNVFPASTSDEVSAMEGAPASNIGVIQNSTAPSDTDVQNIETGGPSPADTAAITAAPTDVPVVPDEPVIDDWNYVSDTIAIHIEKVERGEGGDKITYYKADVELKDQESLKTALAKNQFGTNIIQDTSVIAEDNAAIFAVNGDYYGFRDNGIIIRNGLLLRDEPTRSALAVYNDGSMQSIDETKTSGAELLKQGVVQTFSFGPVLVLDNVAITDFGKIAVDAWDIENNNPRTGIGMISPNHFIFLVVDGRMSGYSRGMSLIEFAQELRIWDVQKLIIWTEAAPPQCISWEG